MSYLLIGEDNSRHHNPSFEEHHGVQPTGYMDNDLEPSRGIRCQDIFRKTDQFRLDPTQSCAPGLRCDLVSSAYHLALWKCTGISRYSTNPRLCSACKPSTTSNPAPTHHIYIYHIYIYFIYIYTSQINALKERSSVCTYKQLMWFSINEQKHVRWHRQYRKSSINSTLIVNILCNDDDVFL